MSKHTSLGIMMLLMVSFPFYAQTIPPGTRYIKAMATNVEFRDNNQIAFDDLKEGEKVYRYELEYVHKIPFLRIYKEGRVEEYLVLYNDLFMILYTKGKKSFYDIWIKSFRFEGEMNDLGAASSRIISASSELKEGNVIYAIDNINTIDLETPWVEGAKGSGTGEWITLKGYTELDSLIIFSGYVSYEKPYLYTQNARPKKIRVTCKEVGFEKDFDIADTPNPQVLEFGRLIKVEDITITILDVYPGTKYENMCIHAIWKRRVPNR
ncbi:hypothetical protein WKV44_10480 [Spirochaetia bacterium 38H-sp]|uniref:NAD glycohydrolase translocation F5/8 type C domain-containing protein n=1 Tax=Rarispira pelagica TaxID=3141764 RepID=A0ABU9UET1_9SPIR